MTWPAQAPESASLTLGSVTLGSVTIVAVTLAIVGALSLAAAWVDASRHRLPNVLVLPCYPVVLLGLLVAAGLGTPGWLPAAVGAAAWGVPIGLLWLVGRGAGMGPGDAKIALPLGATLGWVSVAGSLLGVLAAFVAGGGYVLVVQVVQAAKGRGHSRLATVRVPFGPFLVLGWALGLLACALIAWT